MTPPTHTTSYLVPQFGFGHIISGLAAFGWVLFIAGAFGTSSSSAAESSAYLRLFTGCFLCSFSDLSTVKNKYVLHILVTGSNMPK